MTSLFIRESKITIPDCSPCLPRTRLYSFLDEHRHAKLITVISEPGYGKTTLISGYVRERNIPAVWYRLNESDRYPHILLTHLKAALCLNSGHHLTQPVMPESVREELEEVSLMLSNWTSELYLVFDDIQMIQSVREILDILSLLIRESSSRVTFVLIGQQLPSLPYASYKVQRQYAEITNRELAFSREEVEAFFRDASADPLESFELELIVHKTEGWPASLQLVRDAIQGRTREERERIWKQFPALPHIYDYLASEVLDRQQPEIRRILLMTSILKELDSAIIRQYLEPADPDVLESLSERFLFVRKNARGEFEFHRLFRSFLFELYRKETDRHEMERNHRQLSAIYERHYKYFHAFAHAMLGGDYSNAVRLMRTLEIRYQPLQFIDLIENWLEEFFARQSLASPIFVYRSVPLSILQKLIPHLENSLALLENQQHAMGVASVKQQVAGIYMLLGELEKARHLFEESLQMFERLQDWHMVMLNLNIMSELLLNLNQTAQAKAYAQRCLFLAETEGAEHFRLYALSGLADILIEEGAPEAGEYLDKALEGSGADDNTLNLYIYCGKSKYYSERNEPGAAVEWGLKAVRNADEFGIGYDTGLASHHLGMAYMCAGQWEAAEEALNRSYLNLQSFAFNLTQVVSSQYELLLNRGAAEAERQAKWMELTRLCREHGYPWIENRFKERQPDSAVEWVEPVIAPSLKIETLGKLQIAFDHRPVQIKRRASLRLLLYLIVNNGRRIPQEVLMEELFPDQSPESAQNQLYVALSVLRSTLEPSLQSGRHSSYIGNSEGLYSLHHGRIDLDLNTFLNMSGISGQSHRDMEHLIRAEQLYRGDLLEEYRYEPFIEPERERIRIKYLQVLSKLAGHYAEQGDCYRSMEYYEKLISKDPYNEANYRAYIAMLEQYRLPSHAASVAERMRRALAE
ncbi:HTH-type transcriptional regulator MalT [compost metagenome]